ncbi:MAG: outer membrane beta-barrel protein, partial [Flavobacteriales bacterium]
GWQANLSGNYRSDMVYSQLLLEGFGTLGLGIQKGLWDGKGNLRLSIEDALFTSIGAGVINNLDQTEANWNSVRDTRRASIAFSYNFGRGRQGKGRRNTSGSDDEQQRVRG